MALSVQKDQYGPDWPLGSIAVPVPGTPVGIMSVVDSASTNAPESASGTSSFEYTPTAQQIIFQAVKVGAGPPALTNNTGNVYIVRKGAGGGSGNKTDTGSIVKMLIPGETFTLSASPQNRNVLNPYRYSIDADTAADACQVTLIIQ